MAFRESTGDRNTELLMQALEFMPMPAALIDCDGRVCAINAQAREFLRLSGDLLGQHFETLLHVASSWEFAEQLHEVIDKSMAAAAEPCCRSGQWQCHRIGEGQTQALICYFVGDGDVGRASAPTALQHGASLDR